MTKLLTLFFVFLSGASAYAQSSGVPKAELDSYVEVCKKLMLDSNSKQDPKDVDMLCRDPYLRGQPNESKEDLARRQRLMKETDAKKDAMVMELPKTTKTANSDLMSKKELLKACKKMILDNDPGKDPEDVKMLCSDPYLKGKENESQEDQARRKRLIREADQAKDKMLKPSVRPPTKASEPGQR